MKNDEILTILRKLGIKLNEFNQYPEISSIKLASGREVFQDWLHMRIAFGEDCIKLQYGRSFPYGARISTPLYFSGDYKSFVCKVNEENKIIIQPNPITNEVFREPRFGDTVRISIGKTILSEALITNVVYSQGTKIINLAQPVSSDGRLSFFDSAVYSKNGTCDHGVSLEGCYMKFQPNEESISKKETVHEIIRYKEITTVNLSVQNNKEYKI